MTGAIRGLRQWAYQPATYEQLAAEECGEAEPFSASSSAGDSSSSIGSSGRRGSTSSTKTFFEKPLLGAGHHGSSSFGAGVQAALLLPTLAVRCAHLGWLLATEPIRRRRHRLEPFRVLVPSFLQPADPGATPRRLHPTAWLDGLRGLAAFFVVWHHASLLWFGWHIHEGYGSTPAETWLIQLPIVRLAVSGPPHVAVFFVISGYALSYKPLRLARQRRFAEAGEAIHSATFRRHLRLFLMPVLVTFVAALAVYWDLYGVAGDWGHGVAIPSRRPPQATTLAEQLHNWWLNVLSLTNPINKDLRRGGKFGYDPNLWTLPVEFDCSLSLFLCQAALLRLRSRVRLLLVLAVTAYALKYMYWQHFLFFAGMLMCDLHFELDGLAAAAPAAAPVAPMAPATTVVVPESLPVSEDAAPTRPAAVATAVAASTPNPPSTRRTAGGIAVFVLSLYLLSMPESGRGGLVSPGYRTLFDWVPALHKKHDNTDFFWVPLAAALLVLSIDRTPVLQRRLFMPALPQYLGRISYSLYLVHGPLLFSAGHWLVRHTTALSGGLASGRKDEDPNAAALQLRYGLGVGLSAVFLWALLIFVADLASRTIDVQAVRLGHVLYARLGQKEPAQEAVLPRTA